MKINKLILTTVGAASLFAATTVAANADSVTYTVKSGDTVAKIAAKYNTTVSAIEKANNLSNVNMIYVGDKLTISNGSSASSTTSQSTSSTSTTSNSSSSSDDSSSTSTTSSSSAEEAAKEWIANKESGGSYTASNGNYYGKYQLSKSYLNGDYSASNQEKVANEYVSSRYGSWVKAKQHWEQYGWY